MWIGCPRSVSVGGKSRVAAQNQAKVKQQKMKILERFGSSNPFKMPY